MAKTISELRNQSIQVRDASAAGENTATRVGTVLNDIVGHIEDYENTQSSNNSSQDAKIEGVKSLLNAEIARAKTEESNLSTQIGTERTERQAAVSREETARIQADNDEKTARENADITLRTMIQTEVSNRQIAVKQEEIRAKAAEQANTQAIADEVARAKAAEQANAQSITDEVARAKAAEQANAQAIEDENTRATAEEGRLQGEIDNTIDNLNSLEDKVNSNHDHFSDEVARLDLTDNEIKGVLESEIARAKAAEQAIIFDVSAHNNGIVFESIQALLSSSNLSTLIPTSFRHGGMTIRFIQGSEQSSDNNYVQYRCKTQSFSANPDDWEGEELKTKDAQDADFAISDESKNDIVRFSNGHVKTKNFDSSDSASKDYVKAQIHTETKDAQDADFAISDESKNDIVRFSNGHVKTKNFDSETDCNVVTYGNRSGLSIEDEQGNTILDIHGGFPYTKNFDGADVTNKSENATINVAKINERIPVALNTNEYNSTFLTGLRSRIDTVMKQVFHGCSFVFVTDLHFIANPRQSQHLIRYILDNTVVPYAICGGDFVQAYGGMDDIIFAYNCYHDFVEAVGKNRIATVRGNHDYTIRESASSNNGITMPYAFTYNGLGRINEEIVSDYDAEHLVWCITNEVQKVKIFGCNSCDAQETGNEGAWGVSYKITPAQMQWVCNRVENGYKYIFVSHIPTSTELTDNAGVTTQKPLRDLMIAMNGKTSYSFNGVTKDFTDMSFDFVCHICGHEHLDVSDDSDGILEIVTTSDAYHGTQAFDVFTFDFDNQKINAIRVGYGNDRVFNY